MSAVEIDFEFGGNEYKAGRLPAMAAFHISRRLAPALIAIASSSSSIAEGSSSEDALKSLSDLSRAIALMDDSQAEYIIYGLLASVKRKLPNGMGYGPVMSPNNTLMYQDIDMVSMIAIASKSFMVNLANFTDALPSGSKEALLKLKEQFNG